MTPAEHYEAAESYLAMENETFDLVRKQYLIQLAQAHATLACAPGPPPEPPVTATMTME